MTRQIITAFVAITLAACTDRTGPVDRPVEQLLFLSARDASAMGKDIYRINADGTGVENLTRNPGAYQGVSLSPDARRVAFSTSHMGCGIWAMNVDGTNLHKLTNQNGGVAEGCNHGPAWSPDGSRIAFLSHREGRVHGTTHGVYDVYVMNSDGSNPHNVSHSLGAELGFSPEVTGWSPDGRVVFQTADVVAGAFVRRAYVVKADGTDLKPLFSRSGDHSAAWSPDGSKIVFISERDGRPRLYIMNADGSGERALTAHVGDDRLPGAGFEYNPWSPNGTRIAFEHRPLNDFGSIHVINPDGSGLRRLTGKYNGIFNGWSPSGERIAYSEWVYLQEYVAADVFVVNVDDGQIVNLTNSAIGDSDALWLGR